MKRKEELIGAEVLALVNRLHPVGGHPRQRIRKTLKTAVEALALLSLAHELAPARSRPLALAATGVYVQHKRRKHRHGHHR